MRQLFGTDGIRGKANHYPMTPELCLKLGKAIALHFGKKGIFPKVVIGKDTRVSGYMLETALTSGLVSMGATVLLAGPMPTPAVSFLVRSLEADAGIMISASHNPAEDNGIKLFDSQGYKLSDSDEYSIEALIFSDGMKNGAHDGRPIGKAFRVEDAQQRYRDWAKRSVNGLSLKGMKIAVDCANGAAYRVCPQLLSELGAAVIALNNQPDGANINNACGATCVAGLSKRVAAEGAALGIALDGDADRVVLVDEVGREINGDEVMAAIALDLKRSGGLANDALVATHMSNTAFEEFMRAGGISVVRARVGDRYVIEEMRKRGLSLGGEQSGHIILAEYSATGDGIICALRFLRIMRETGRKASELAHLFEPFPQVLVNVNVREKPAIERVQGIVECIQAAEKELGGKGRVMVRYSGTENVLRIMVEGKDQGRIKKLAAAIAESAKEAIGA